MKYTAFNVQLWFRDEERRVELVSEEENQDPIKVHQAELAEWRPHTQVPTGLCPQSILYSIMDNYIMHT